MRSSGAKVSPGPQNSLDVKEPALDQRRAAGGKRAQQRVLIYLLGSVGDTLVAVPALRLVAQRFPDAERRVLTDYIIKEQAAPMTALLDGTSLVDGYFRYPPGGVRSVRQMLHLWREISRWKPDTLIYLHEPRGSWIALRDASFFLACGIRKLIGVPYANHLKKPLFKPQLKRYEHRSEYLARSLVSLGALPLSDRMSWDLALTTHERDAAHAALTPLQDCKGILAASIGAKVDVKDWGDDNWTSVLRELSQRLPGWGLALIGAPVERQRSERLLAAWQGNGVNLCGSISLRQSGAVLEMSDVYLGHDSGPMHFAATVGTPCVAIFSARSQPGKWFPYGENHKVLYKQTECFGCQLDQCLQFQKKCIMSISVQEVADATVAAVEAATDQRLNSHAGRRSRTSR